MRFSIIIPIYNSAKYLYKCLDSVCKQLFDDFEIVCINDGSTDCSLDILEKYRKSFPFINIYTQENAGPSVARNKGLSIAQGEYVLFCDSDDWFERETVLSEIDTYIKQQNRIVDVVYFPGNTNWSGNTVSATGFIKQSYQSGWDLLSNNCLQSKGTNLFFGAMYAYAYRLEVIRIHSLSFNREVSYSEDRLFVFDFLDKAAYSIVYSVPCYFYNVRTNSLMTNSIFSKKKMIDELHVAEIMINRKWLHRKTYEVKKYISSFYLTCIKNLLRINEYPKINHKLELIYTVSSLRRLIGFVIMYISPVLYKKIMKL